MTTVYCFPSSQSSEMHDSRKTGVHISSLSYRRSNLLNIQIDSTCAAAKVFLEFPVGESCNGQEIQCREGTVCENGICKVLGMYVQESLRYSMQKNN